MDDAISRQGKVFLLAYDQGMEHGPSDFNPSASSGPSYDPNYILKIAQESGVYTGIIFGEGLAEKYRPQLPLILKLNGKTGFHKGEELVSLQLTSVDKAIELGAVGVGYTIYIGSEHEEEMMVEFRRICDEAHTKKLIVIAWMYPRGKHVEGREEDPEVVAYAARLGLELGADYVKVPYCDKFEWVVKNAGKTKVLAQGGLKKEEGELLAEVTGAMAAGAAGMAIGRNIWQGQTPVELSQKIAKIIWPQ